MFTETRQRGRPKKYSPNARTLAAQAGQCHYFDPTPCVRGHISERYVSNGGCLACHLAKRGHPHTGPRVNPDLLTVIDLAQKSEQRQLANLKRRITDMQLNVAQRYAELRRSLIQTQSKENSKCLQKN
jgi:hypothetical protein